MKVKLTDYGVVSRPSIIADEEDERRNAALAARAQRGDYDEGGYMLLL